MKSTKISFLLIVLLVAVIYSCSKDEENETPQNQINIPDGYSLLWSDEFNGTSIDQTKWQFQTGDGTAYGLPAGWGNNELQNYTSESDNSGIESNDGTTALFIKALSDGNGGYSSARLVTNDLFSMRFGRIDIKAKMPQGQGVWAAIWMLGDNIDQIDWPGCGEIDIVEVIGNNPATMYATLHYTNSENAHGEIQTSHELSTGTFSDAYHIFSLDWTPDHLTFSVDGFNLQQTAIENDMKEFLRSFYLVLNIAVGGNWPGPPDNSTSFPQTMLVDYIRVFEKNGFEAPDAPVLDIDEETIGQNIEPGLAQHAIKDDFTDLGDATVLVWGGGGEPTVSASGLAINGDSSLVFEFPGGSWGGGYIELDSPTDLSNYTHIKFSIYKPETITNAEIKLESPATNAVIFLSDYTGTSIGEEFIEYSIPLVDFTGLELTEISIPFSMWNPQDDDGNFVAGTILIDNVYFSD